MKLNIIKTFSWAHQGVNVKEYVAGSDIDTDDKDMVNVAIENGWASEDVEDNTKRSRKAKSD